MKKKKEKIKLGEKRKKKTTSFPPLTLCHEEDHEGQINCNLQHNSTKRNEKGYGKEGRNKKENFFVGFGFPKKETSSHFRWPIGGPALFERGIESDDNTLFTPNQKEGMKSVQSLSFGWVF